jgi:hypothetical protein
MEANPLRVRAKPDRSCTGFACESVHDRPIVIRFESTSHTLKDTILPVLLISSIPSLHTCKSLHAFAPTTTVARCESRCRGTRLHTQHNTNNTNPHSLSTHILYILTKTSPYTFHLPLNYIIYLLPHQTSCGKSNDFQRSLCHSPRQTDCDDVTATLGMVARNSGIDKHMHARVARGSW